MDGDGGEGEGEGETGSEEENKDEFIQETQQEPPTMEEFEPDEKSPLTQETQVSSIKNRCIILQDHIFFLFDGLRCTWKNFKVR